MRDEFVTLGVRALPLSYRRADSAGRIRTCDHGSRFR